MMMLVVPPPNNPLAYRHLCLLVCLFDCLSFCVFVCLLVYNSTSASLATTPAATPWVSPLKASTNHTNAHTSGLPYPQPPYPQPPYPQQQQSQQQLPLRSSSSGTAHGSATSLNTLTTFSIDSVPPPAPPVYDNDYYTSPSSRAAMSRDNAATVTGVITTPGIILVPLQVVMDHNLDESLRPI